MLLLTLPKPNVFCEYLFHLVQSQNKEVSNTEPLNICCNICFVGFLKIINYIFTCFQSLPGVETVLIHLFQLFKHCCNSTDFRYWKRQKRKNTRQFCFDFFIFRRNFTPEFTQLTEKSRHSEFWLTGTRMDWWTMVAPFLAWDQFTDPRNSRQ